MNYDLHVFKTVERSSYHVDENNNKWDATKYTLEEATKYSRSLENCTDCSNCKFCSDCANCNDCNNCENCKNCVDCKNCRHYYNCNDCKN